MRISQFLWQEPAVSTTMPVCVKERYREHAIEATLSCTRPGSFQYHGTRTHAIQCHDVKEQDLLITLLARSFNVLLLAPVTPRQQGQTVIQRRLSTTVSVFSRLVYTPRLFFALIRRSRRL